MFDLALYEQCAPNVAKATMQAIVKTESRGNPLAIGLNKGYKLKYPAKDLAQAKKWVQYLEQNKFNFDVGLAQVNIKNIHKYGYKAEDALDPCLNLQLASQILKLNYRTALSQSSSSEEALSKAISAYNTGNFSRGFSNGYVGKVYANAGVSSAATTPPIEYINNKSKVNIKKYNHQPGIDPNKSKTVLYVRGANAAAAFY